MEQILVEKQTGAADADFKQLNVELISISGNNPRKRFDDDEMGELSSSISKTGVISPILVRPTADGTFELICGERRLKASIMAGLSTIPSYIKNLSDEDAFEAMILENLQRSDVHPLEESEAFAKMLDTGNYTVADIAAKMGKSQKLVLQRIKLSELIDVIKEDFFNNELAIAQAVAISRLGADLQLHVYENYKDSWQADGYGTLSELTNFIDNKSLELDDAPFDTEDENLLAGCTSCSICPKRAGTVPMLFEEIENPDTCFDAACFERKSNKAFENAVSKAVSEDSSILFANDGWSVSASVKEMLDSFSISVIEKNLDYRSYEIEGLEKRSAINVSGNSKGELVDIWLMPKEILKGEPNAPDDARSKQEIDNEKELKRITEREKRNKELDLEKVQAKFAENLAEINKGKAIDGYTIEGNFISGMLLYIAITKVYQGNFSTWLRELDIDCDFASASTADELIESLCSISQDNMMKLVAKMVYNQFHFERRTFGAKFVEKLLSLNPANKMEQIQQAQDEIAEKRNDRLALRIKGLVPKIKTVIEKEKYKHEDIADEAEDVAAPKEQPEAEEPLEPVFKPVAKRYAVSSYFKHRKPDSPGTVLECFQYLKEHGKLPYETAAENLAYDAYYHFQKRAGVQFSQHFTPDATALRMAEIADKHFHANCEVIDACCGFGQLSAPLASKGFILKGFDQNAELVEIYNTVQGENCSAEILSIDEMYGLHMNLIANPPYEIPVITSFFENLEIVLDTKAIAVLLLPVGLVDKTKPKRLAKSIAGFTVLEREDMKESFGHTTWKSEIVVLQKND